jgi:acetate kinase
MPLLLALNCGSSSLKFRLLELPSLETLGKGQASAIGTDKATLTVKPAGPSGKKAKASKETHNRIFGDSPAKVKPPPQVRASERAVSGETHDGIFGDLLETLGKDVTEQIKVVTHRIVHGGDVSEPLVVDKDHTEGLQKMEALSGFAPLHNHHAVLTVKGVSRVMARSPHY